MCPFSVEESHVCTETHKGPGAFPKKLPALGYTAISKRGGALALDSSETWKLASKPRLPTQSPWPATLAELVSVPPPHLGGGLLGGGNRLRV